MHGVVPACGGNLACQALQWVQPGIVGAHVLTAGAGPPGNGRTQPQLALPPPTRLLDDMWQCRLAWRSQPPQRQVWAADLDAVLPKQRNPCRLLAAGSVLMPQVGEGRLSHRTQSSKL